MERAESRRFEGLRVLIVEDEALVSLMMADMLSDLGCQVIGPAATVRFGLELVAHHAIDGAILDFDVGGETSYPIADLLLSRETPFAFATGYGSEQLDPRFQEVLTISKPFQLEALEAAIRLFAEAQATETARSRNGAA